MYKNFRIALDEGSAGGAGSGGTASQQTDDWKTKYEASQAELTAMKGQLTAKATEAEEATKRFTGLQQVFQKEKDAHTLLQTEHGKLQTQFQTAFTEAETLKGSVAEQRTAMEKLQGDHAAATTSLTRARLIMDKFPILAPFEAKGLLPTPGKDQTLEQILTEFSGNLDQIAKNAQAKFASGGSIEPVGKNNLGGGTAGAMTANAIQLKMNEASIRGDNAEYNRLMDEYLKVTSPTA